MKATKDMPLRDKAIEVIDMISCDDDFGFSETREAKVLRLIYRYAHVAQGHCGNPHLDWAEDLERHHEALKSGVPGTPMIPEAPQG